MSHRSNYRRLQQSETNAEEYEEELKKRTRADRLDRITAKIHAVFWVAAAVCIFIFTDILNVALYNEKVNRIALNLTVICFIANMGIIIYLTIWLPYIKKITIPWDIYCPNMIPISTALTLATILLSMITFWPVWGFLTPIIIFVLLLGLIFSLHFIPWPF